ncbi:hypothetical protein [Nocardia amikacinitolerans]|uniref:hypothetical protein n=1 Tax=Nocardia amikacinitolerans TaxID=756689 RepID=UPI0020A2DEE4|nr:hypothetical protein [Nocardia amikacinitolerans]
MSFDGESPDEFGTGGLSPGPDAIAPWSEAPCPGGGSGCSSSAAALFVSEFRSLIDGDAVPASLVDGDTPVGFVAVAELPSHAAASVPGFTIGPIEAECADAIGGSTCCPAAGAVGSENDEGGWGATISDGVGGTSDPASAGSGGTGPAKC